MSPPPFMLSAANDALPERFDATADESECIEDLAPGAAIVAAAAMWFADNRIAIGVGIYIGCLLTTGGAWLIGRIL